jgi:hypothetical protein
MSELQKETNKYPADNTDIIIQEIKIGRLDFPISLDLFGFNFCEKPTDDCLNNHSQKVTNFRPIRKCKIVKVYDPIGIKGDPFLDKYNQYTEWMKIYGKLPSECSKNKLEATLGRWANKQKFYRRHKMIKYERELILSNLEYWKWNKND